MDRPPRNHSYSRVYFAFYAGYALIVFLTSRNNRELADSIAISGLSFLFFAVAIAQIRTGYYWRQNVPGNRGPHRSENPARFLASTVLHVCVGLMFVALAIWRYFHLRS